MSCHCRSCTTLKGTYATVFSGHCHTTGQSVAIKRTATNSWGIVVKTGKHIDGNTLKCIAEFAAYKYSPSWNPNAIRLKTCDGSQVQITIHSCRQTELECVSDIFRTQQLERGIMRPTILEPGTIKRYVWTEGFWKNGVRSPHPVEEGVPATALREMSLLRDWVFLVSLNGALGRLNRVIWGSRKKETSPTHTIMSKGAISGTLWVLLGSEEVPSTHTSYVSMM